MDSPDKKAQIHTAAARRAPLVGIVGPCGAGKSTLVEGLEAKGYRCRHIAQEHSYVQAMWQKIAKPDVLIFLDASYAASTARRNLNWQKKDHEEQYRRLRHARQHAHMVIDTDALTPEQVLEKALNFLKESAV